MVLPAVDGRRDALPHATRLVRPPGSGDRCDHELAGRIGPNAIIRVAEALEERVGLEATTALFEAAGLVAHLVEVPQHMVDERDVATLQHRLRVSLGADPAREIALDAGARTGDYLLRNRIPRLAQAVLRRLPPAAAARLLARAIGAHAWTFAGSGRFSYAPGRPFRFVVERCPLCRRMQTDAPACHYYAATFERIFRALVHPRVRVVETDCEAMGGTACAFEARW